MRLTLELKDRVWIISRGKMPAAEIHLDHCHQVDEVVLYADTSNKVQLRVLHLAAWHVLQYVKNRRVPLLSGLATACCGDRTLTASDSRRLMDFGLISEHVQKLDRNAIEAMFHHIYIDVCVAVHRTVDQAINAAAFQVGVPSLRHRLLSERVFFGRCIALQFTVAKPERFIFWKSERKPDPDHDGLHIVSSYHPVMNGGVATGMINGDTSAYIRGYTVESIYCPRASQVNRHEHVGMGSWKHVEHPVYVIGRSLCLTLTTTKVRSKEGVAELAELLRSALGKSKQYIEVSGGFNPPLRSPHNRLNEIGRRSPWPRADYSATGHRARGSEDHCVWTHRTLQKEGTLAQSYVPSWFITEDWLGIYEGAEVRPDVY